MLDMIIIGLGLCLSAALCAHFAQKRGRDPIVWFFLGILLGLLALILLFILPPATREKPVGPIETSASLPETGLNDSSWDQGKGTKEEVVAPQAHSLDPSDIPLVERDWFYLDADRTQVGPLLFADLQDQFKDGSVDSDTYLWSEGMKNWQYLKDLEELQSLLSDDAEV